MVDQICKISGTFDNIVCYANIILQEQSFYLSHKYTNSYFYSFKDFKAQYEICI